MAPKYNFIFQSYTNVSADPFGRIKEIDNLQSNCHVDVAGVSCARPFPGA